MKNISTYLLVFFTGVLFTVLTSVGGYMVFQEYREANPTVDASHILEEAYHEHDYIPENFDSNFEDIKIITDENTTIAYDEELEEILYFTAGDAFSMGFIKLYNIDGFLGVELISHMIVSDNHFDTWETFTYSPSEERAFESDVRFKDRLDFIESINSETIKELNEAFYKD